ncbi:DUF3299 domain-containing protein [Pigmentiphaga litoralis]|uniref:DUF3299 domain-containing protein n=1 Tax=Pigmentiphaga litoralis TaxID=516702 RepID=A0A7Y9IQE8_9BURK|nr:DUF3299 domain-containing protein [Pigmentiphaga litoralis]NYE25309.1 hypothetical protein [Pigmentiphaga litoralis]NYE81078.1 hypothetical protein [Pigmentiphaga litoralis]
MIHDLPACLARWIAPVVVALASTLPVLAHAHEHAPEVVNPHGDHQHDTRELSAADFRNPPANLVLWGTLAKTYVARKNGGVFTATFPPAVRSLDGKRVTLVGFVTQVRDRQPNRQFLVSATPILCTHCTHPDPAAIVEVNTKRPFAGSNEPVRVRGTLQLVTDAPNALVYRLNDSDVVTKF